MMRTRTRLMAAVAAIVTTVGLASCASSDDVSGSGSGSTGDGDSITIGSADFPESRLIAEIYAQALEGSGVTVQRQLGIGSREVYLQALEDGSIDVLPEYIGGLITYYDPQNTLVTSDEVYGALPELLPDGIAVLDKSDAEDKDALAVTQETADSGVTSLADLVGKNFILGGQAEFETRASGVPGLERVYGIKFAEFRSMTTGPLTAQALNSGDIQVAVVFTTQPEIVQNNWVVLEDPENLFIAQNIAPLVRSDAVTGDAEGVLNDVSAAMTTEDLTAMMVQVSVDKADIATVAKEFLTDNDLN